MIYDPHGMHLFHTKINGVDYRDDTFYNDREFQMIADRYHGELPLNLYAFHFDKRRKLPPDLLSYFGSMERITIPVYELILGRHTDVAEGLRLYQPGRSRSGTAIWRRYLDFVLVRSDCSANGRLAYLDGKESLLLSKYMAFPISLADANEYVDLHHRHNCSVQGHKFSIAVRSVEGKTVGVIILGLPIARRQNDGRTLEIRRTCCDERYYNVNSVLMGKAIRIAKEQGYERMITYTLPFEGGGSLKASGFRIDGTVKGDGRYGWDSRTRRRTRPEKYPDGDKLRWVKDLAA